MYKCVIIDDEPDAHDVLVKLLAKLPDFHVIRNFDNAEEALIFFKYHRVDIVFLDINMPEITGIEFMEITKSKNLMVIFTTAYPQHALRAFDFNPVDYLVKPIELSYLVRSLERAMERINPARNRSFFVNTDKKYIRVDFDNIEHIQAERDYVNVHLLNQKLLLRMPFKVIRDRLPEEEFVQLNRSVLVAIKFIKEIIGNEVILNNALRFLITPTFRESVALKMKALTIQK